MHTKLFAFILFSIAFKTLNAQNYIDNYYPSIYKAEANFQKKKFKEALEYYKEAFSKEEPLRPNLNMAIKCAIKAKQYEIATKWLELSVSKGADWKKIDGLKKLKSKIDWDFEKEKLIDIRLKWQNSLDSGLIEELEKMVEKDQLYRTGKLKKYRTVVVKTDTIKSWSTDSLIFIPQIGFNIQRKYDEENIKRLIEILNRKGYPEERLIGPFKEKREYQDVFTGIGLIVIHGFFLREYKDTLTTLLKKEIKEGRCYPELLGYSLDYSEGSVSQTYGTGHFLKFSFPPFHLYKLKYPNELNRYRAGIGMEPLDNYYQRHKFLINRKSLP